MRILHLAIALDAGGMENGLLNLARCLPPAEFDPWVCGMERRGRLAERWPDPARAVTLHKPAGISLRTVGRLADLCRELQPQILHTHNLGPLIYGSAAVGLMRRPPRLIHGEHRQLLEGETGPAKLALRKFLYGRCAAIHTVSHALRDHLIDLRLPDSRLTAIPNGVDLTRYTPGDRPAARAACQLPATATIIGIAAALRPEKGHVRLIRAFDTLASSHRDLHLAIIGDGPERGAIEGACKTCRAASRIHLAGHQDDPAPWYRSLDLMVLPSSAEGLSNAVLEAMACGTPVLASLVCGNAELIQDGHTGFLFDHQIADLEQTIRQCLADRGRLADIAHRAADQAARHWSLDNMAEQYAELYRKVVNKK